KQSEQTFIWLDDAEKLGFDENDENKNINLINNVGFEPLVILPGQVNRQNAALVAQGIQWLLKKDDVFDLGKLLDKFPGVSRRFEQIIPGLFTDYAHTPPKIEGALQLAHEVAESNVVVIYEGLHNTRQHFIKDDLKHLFDEVKKLYIVPSYLAREDENLQLLSPADLRTLLSPESQAHTEPMQLDDNLKLAIQSHLNNHDLVLCLTAGGGNSLDEWLRKEFAT
ncbi:MAG TPA: hypothetical protein VLG47_01040, partial [Candidatus Saccharimonadales bacterium]|nr:hypothetical protein [Candidatus Saccharimonadales bacterium]